MASFEPTDDQRLMRETVADFARTKIRDRVRATEAARGLPSDLRDGLVELGLAALSIPEAHGGAGLGLSTAVIVEEELAYADPAVPFAMPGPGALAHALLELGDDAQIARVLAPFAADPRRVGAFAWSEARPHRDRAGFVTTATRDGDGWILEGRKSFVIGAGVASTYVVCAQIDERAGWDGIGAFVVDADRVRVSARHRTVGLDAATIADVDLDRVRVTEGDRLRGRAQVSAGGSPGASAFGLGLRRTFARISLHVAARAVGLARSAFELARAYADERRAFGKPIGHFQSIAFTLADRHIDVEGARALVQRAAWTFDRGADERLVLSRAAEAVAEAVEVAQRAADDAVQIHGGAGFVRDYLVEKWMRDAKTIALCAPTATTSDQLFAALALDAPLDPALVLPVPEIQPIFT